MARVRNGHDGFLLPAWAQLVYIHFVPMITEAELMRTFPHIAWRTPVPTALLGSQDTRLACRLCIGMKGLKSTEIPDLPKTPEQFAKHMAFTHQLSAIFEDDSKLQ